MLSCNPAAGTVHHTPSFLQGWWAGNGQELWRGSGGLTPDAEPPKAPSTGGFQLGTLFYSNQQITAVLQYWDPVRRPPAQLPYGQPHPAAPAAGQNHACCWKGAAPWLFLLCMGACRPDLQ